MQSLILVQVIVALLLIFSVLLQNRGTSSGMAFGGDFGGSYYAKRGFEKVLFYVSVVLGAVFIILAGVNTVLFKG